MDVNELRELLIKYNGLQNTDEVYTFYYDETNNIRKLYLKDSGFNVVKADNFILAGILHKGLSTDSDYSTLFQKLNLQKSVNELKLRYIAKGSFLDMLESDKLLIILNWLIENNFYIHYFNLNITYWSIIDIVDSIIGELHNPFYIMNHMSLKSDFYELANSNPDVFLNALHKFNYPDIPEEKVYEFCLWLIDFTCMHSCMLPDFRAHALENLVKESLKIEELPFISGFHGRKLIDSFMVFYLRNLYLFKNSVHIFDEEKSIQDEVKNFPLTENGIPIQNHEFVKSHNSEAIQLSDVIAGFLGKYFSYLKDVNDEQLAIDKSALTSKQFKTLSALKHIIDVSDDVSRGFFNEVSSEGERRRNNRFLHGV
ncbi:DUF3800 domain-containing protein [Escherichia albertii]|uniref:DUF3800 domain-containing protein n=1 Tax=Escherichia TaxID=561 RepID=UPI000B7D1DFD|nr:MULTISPECIES: DUF3800 domain-containing protein [Escherichia]EEW2001181.1 hypothetical protein [Escherichia coli]EJJ6390096.1 DUF3800 domain-containing protein [Escherichia albertii]EKB0155133.1 DUF3800 domain-containing protein [Escherichia albertii]MCZ9071479.1 DUF3800 domain-containing protein [Escherichia albertii]QMH57068.1 DUF3800 domain-containing protein [Escherichia fergusonii]